MPLVHSCSSLAHILGNRRDDEASAIRPDVQFGVGTDVEQPEDRLLDDQGGATELLLSEVHALNSVTRLGSDRLSLGIAN